jgi:ATP-dependent RNA helicase DDX27
MTVDSDVEDFTPTSNPMGFQREDDEKLDPDFVFDISGDPYVDFSMKAIGVEDLVMSGTKPVRHLFFQKESVIYLIPISLATNVS